MDTLKLQNHIRNNAEEVSSFLSDISKWEKSMNKKFTQNQISTTTLNQQSNLNNKSSLPIRESGTIKVNVTSTTVSQFQSSNNSTTTNATTTTTTTSIKDAGGDAHTYDKGYKKWDAYNIDDMLQALDEEEKNSTHDTKSNNIEDNVTTSKFDNNSTTINTLRPAIQHDITTSTRTSNSSSSISQNNSNGNVHDDNKDYNTSNSTINMPITSTETSSSNSTPILTPATIITTTNSRSSSSSSNISSQQSTTLSRFAVVPPARGRNPLTAEEIEVRTREQGNHEYSSGNYQEAIKLYTTCLGLKAMNYIAFSNRAMAYMKLKQYHQAELDCNCALSIHPAHLKSIYRRAVIRNILCKHRAAYEDLLSILDIEPNNQEALLELKKTKDFLKAAVSKVPAVTLTPTFIHTSADCIADNNMDSMYILQGPDLPYEKYL